MNLESRCKAVQIAGKDKARLDVSEGAEHGDGVFETSENMEKVGAFLGEHMK